LQITSGCLATEADDMLAEKLFQAALTLK
jgi:hypothetical protein